MNSGPTQICLILVGTKICQENVQEKQIYDATIVPWTFPWTGPWSGITISQQNSELYGNLARIIFHPNYDKEKLSDKIHLKIEDNLQCVLLFYILD